MASKHVTVSGTYCVDTKYNSWRTIKSKEMDIFYSLQ